MRTNTAKALNVKNMVQTYVDSWGNEDLYRAYCEMHNQGFISYYTMNCFSDIVADLYLFEDERVWKNGEGKVVYRCNETTGYFEKVQG